jgi:hypothetical protein
MDAPCSSGSQKWNKNTFYLLDHLWQKLTKALEAEEYCCMQAIQIVCCKESFT